jgi:hypothetical protein
MGVRSLSTTEKKLYEEQKKLVRKGKTLLSGY